MGAERGGVPRYVGDSVGRLTRLAWTMGPGRTLRAPLASAGRLSPKRPGRGQSSAPRQRASVRFAASRVPDPREAQRVGCDSGEIPAGYPAETMATSEAIQWPPTGSSSSRAHRLGGGAVQRS